MDTLYIAYGENIDRQTMWENCPGAKLVAKSWLHDFGLEISSGESLNLCPRAGEAVPVLIWAITPEDEKRLEQKREYIYRTEMQVEVLGEMRKAQIYMTVPFRLARISRGYKALNFNRDILIDALRRYLEAAD